MTEPSEPDSFVLDYLDQVVLRLRFGPSPEERPDEVWEYALLEPPTGWSERPLLAEFEQTLRDAPGGPYEFGINTSRSVYSWGADAATLTVAAYVVARALDALVSLSVEGGVRALVKSLARSRTPEPHVPDREEMLGTAQWRVADGFDVDYDALQLVAEEQRPGEGAWEFTFHDAGSRYVVEMGAVEGIPTSSRVRREDL